MIHLYHCNDPDAPQPPHYWDFVYLHGKAECNNGRKAEENEWEWGAPDIFVADQPMPTVAGEYEGELYGRKVMIILSMPHGRTWMCGRVSYTEGDEKALAHARTPEDWR